MADDIAYARMLRPVGQVLETLGMESFFLAIEGADVVVRGRPTVKAQEPGAGLSVKALWRLLRGTGDEQAPAPPTDEVELRYTAEDIARLEAEGRTRRQSSGGAPEAHSLSQILRAAGSFVDQKEGRLLGISKAGPNIGVVYESALKRKISEQFSISELYDFWVKMYLKRDRRPAPQ